MNDLDLMERFRAEAAPMSAEARFRARNGMFAAPRRQPRSPARWAWRIGPVTALAAAVAVAAVLVTRPAEPTAMTARNVLTLAAAEARGEPVLPARPDQFVYVESLTHHGGTITRLDGSERSEPRVLQRRRIWQPVDGKRDALLRQGPVDPRAKNPDPEAANLVLPRCQGVEPNEPCPVEPGYLRGLPTDATAMRAHLHELYTGGQPEDRGAFVAAVENLLRERYVPPAAEAAIFEALATVPGTEVQENVTDLAGRRGIAVGHVLDGARYDLIFDARTYRYLGQREVLVEGYGQAAAGRVNGESARLRVAVVDGPGQLPG